METFDRFLPEIISSRLMRVSNCHSRFLRSTKMETIKKLGHTYYTSMMSIIK